MKERQAVAMLAIAVIGGISQAHAAPKREAEATVQRIVVSIPHRRLAVIRDGEVIKTFSTAVGAPSSPSPKGEFTVINRLVRPTYYAPGKVIPAGRGNPLGTRWMGLSVKGFGIHGTNEPSSIGQAQSHGCIRLRNKDVEELFELVRVGDTVDLRGEADETVVALFGPVPARDTTRPARVSALKRAPKPPVALTLATAVAAR